MRSRVLAVLVVVASLLAPSYAGTLAVPLIGQEMDNWCWNASSNMVLEFYGFPHTQTEVAAWAVGGYNVPNHLSSTTVGPLAAPGAPSPGNYDRKGCGSVLTEFGPVDSTSLTRSLTYDEIKTIIDGGRPAILLIRWLDGAKDVGGHIIVLRGYETGNKVSLADPWPADNNVIGPGTPGASYVVSYDAMFDANSTYSGSAVLGNNWTRTLETGRTLDLCFLIDSTGSMGGDIASVKAASLSMIDDLESNYKNLRIAVVDYRDYPVSPYGDSGDWITLVRSAFTEDANVARAAINAIYTGGGNDTPEAVFSALIRVMDGNTADCFIGEWRKDAERHIILMGDAPGHDPEPWAGGYSYADVLAAWDAEPNKIAIDALLTGSYGYDDEAGGQFSGLAAGTGGTVRSTEDSDAGEAIVEIIDEFTETPRYPRGEVDAFKPTFTFVPPTESMGPAVKNILLEIQKWDTKKLAWKKYMLVKLAADATSWTPTKYLPQGSYQWRAGYVRGAGIFTLPSGIAQKIKAATLMEPNYTAFTREEIAAAAPTMVSPSSYFTAETKDVNYTFSTVAGADSYALGISAYKESKEGWALKLWKKVTVKPKPADAGAATITVKVKGHTIDTEYEWSVQSLNYDHPKPDPNLYP